MNLSLIWMFSERIDAFDSTKSCFYPLNVQKVYSRLAIYVE